MDATANIDMIASMNTLFDEVDSTLAASQFSKDRHGDMGSCVNTDTAIATQGFEAKQTHTSREWSGLKETIRDLYLEQDMSLADLRAYMEAYHGFHAPPHQYKLRLRRWGFKRSYTYQQKEDISRMMAAVGDQTGDVVKIAINGKPVAIDKILRHRRDAKKKTLCAISAGPKCRSCRLHKSSCISCTSQDVGVALVSPRPTFDAAHLHRETNVASHSSGINLENRLWISMTTAEKYISIVHAGASVETESAAIRNLQQEAVSLTALTIIAGTITLITDPQSIGFHLLDISCAFVSEVASRHPGFLFRVVSFLQCLPLWKACPDIHRTLLSFYHQLSHNLLGPSHPVSLLSKLAYDFGQTYDAAYHTRGTIPVSWALENLTSNGRIKVFVARCEALENECLPSFGRVFDCLDCAVQELSTKGQTTRDLVDKQGKPELCSTQGLSGGADGVVSTRDIRSLSGYSAFESLSGEDFERLWQILVDMEWGSTMTCSVRGRSNDSTTFPNKA